ncbi:MAG: isopentenyl-diphosphate Delta-isomerase [Nitrosopumilus sp. D6]|nr:MAG: isopentenyl-diphosphate Delta-isomerase [Nitrosopumilus sp. D6]
MTEYVILVDSNDNAIGTEEKVRCHLPDGKLHRAFTAVLFDKSGRLALARRDPAKMLWPGCWDGTFASHPRESETFVSSGQRRMPDELGISGTLEYMHKFEYHVPYKDIGSENEICGTLVGLTDAELKEMPGEIDGIRWVMPDELVDGIRSDPKIYCPWMLIALRLFGRSDAAVLERRADVLSAWTDTINDALDAAIAHHLLPDKWRIINEH